MLSSSDLQHAGSADIWGALQLLQSSIAAPKATSLTQIVSPTAIGLLDYVPTPIWLAGADGNHSHFNRAWLDFAGRSLEAEVGHGWTARIHPDDARERMRHQFDAILREQPFRAEYRLRRHDGEYRWIEDIAAPLHSPGGTLAGFIGSFHDVTQLKEQSNRDALTGLYNKRYLQHKMDCAQRESLFPMSIVIADLDGLKRVNDGAGGHLAGDMYIRGAAAILTRAFRDDDIVGRYGGDEFVVLLPRTKYEHAQASLDRVRHQMLHYNSEHRDLPVSMSLGAATAQQSSELPATFALADRLMYEDKKARKAGRDYKPDRRALATYLES